MHEAHVQTFNFSAIVRLVEQNSAINLIIEQLDNLTNYNLEFDKVYTIMHVPYVRRTDITANKNNKMTKKKQNTTLSSHVQNLIEKS